ncbi:Na(+)-translocating NADH-quinone reductase subunit C [Sansalvadorimonas verongulae]|uniref:Na(+)-translocating NADH-quinone reductase subunit C n=1 Tax=Sansalvadorimonas verongulae TaxID=2172824 RepID=UPI0012BCDC21|nr:Na(+)-translocating NADH-quinone reductase subunit C [Sansalvadorimonas verongulae]MTI14300.1 Na(+)-translocating NADH-quinone reductase subunit C [Sansalvadorimonas verongulae]
MAKNDTIKKTLGVTIGLSLVCSILVSTAAVSLKPRQDENKVLDVQQNILTISGLEPNASDLTRDEIIAKFKEVTPKLVEIQTGKFYTGTDIDPAAYDQRVAAKNPAESRVMPKNQDTAQIKRQANLAKVYEVIENGKVKTLVLPIHGYGLWSTLYGYIALDEDLQTVVGFGFYEHAETPGLGGEVDNPRWKASWIGKQVMDDNGEPSISIIKGSVDPNSAQAAHQVDGLSGATLTSRGVDHLVNFWLGQNGFGPFLANLKKGDA